MARSALFYSLLITVLCLYFAHTRDVSYRLVACSMVPGLVLGCAMTVLERVLVAVRRRAAGQMSGVQTAFLLFFAYLIGYILFSAIFLSVPVGWAMEHFFDKASLGKEFALFSINYFIVLALASWVRYLRIAFLPTNKAPGAF